MYPEIITHNECVGLLLFDTWKNKPRTRRLTRCMRKRLQEELFELEWPKRRNRIREGRITPEIGVGTSAAAAADTEDTGETIIIEEEEEEETDIMIEETTVDTIEETEGTLAVEGETMTTAEVGMAVVGAGMKTDELEEVTTIEEATTIDEVEQVMTIEEDTTIEEATTIEETTTIEEATTIEEVPMKIEGEATAGTDMKTGEPLSSKKTSTAT